jgi:prevent-host-death family protein
MKPVGLRELKNRLSEYVRLVRAGERVLVTDRGQVVAELVPSTATVAAGPEAALAELDRRGMTRPPSNKGRASYPRFRRLAPKGTARRLLDEERGER